MAHQASKYGGTRTHRTSPGPGNIQALTRRFLLLLILSLTGQSDWAIGTSPLLSEYQHTAFGPHGGAPNDVHCFAQARDGTLWLGTGSGLFRFDGTEFESITMLDGQDVSNRTVVSIHFDTRGGLWLGYGGIGSGYLGPDGKYRKLAAAEGWHTIEAMTEDLDGTLWAVDTDRLVWIAQGVKHAVGAEWGLPDGLVYEARVDKRGTLWVATHTSSGVFYLPRGEKKFHHVTLDFHPTTLLPGPNDTIWGSSLEGGLRALQLRDGVPDRVYAVAKQRADWLLFDRDGGLWINSGEGLLHVADPTKLLNSSTMAPLSGDTFGVQQGLSSSAGWEMFEDREGDVWIGTTRGMDRFRRTAFRPLPLPDPGHGFGVVRGDKGAVWAANWDSKLLRIQGRSVSPMASIGPQTFSLYSNDAGDVWAGGGYGVRHSQDGQHFAVVTTPPEIGEKVVRTMTADSDGRLWGGTAHPSPAWFVKDGAWQSPKSIDGLPDDLKPSKLFTDSAGQVWMSAQTSIYLVKGEHARKLVGDTNAIGLGLLASFYESNGRIWLGGTEGVVMFDGSNFHAIEHRSGERYKYISGIVVRANGDLWMRGPNDAIRVPASEINLWLQTPGYKPREERFDAVDGLIGNVPTSGLKPTLAEGTDGTLWFSGDEGLSSIDPDATRPESIRPRAAINAISADGQPMDLTARTVQLPALVKQLRIRYSAPLLSTPERLQYRYRLDGLDNSWQDAANRREAFYTTLAPGHYRFRLAASVQPGVWGEEETTVEFDVQPAWFQTWLFRAACGVLVLSGLFLLHWLRLRWVSARISLQEGAKLAERIRVARELHDTVLQGTQALVLQVATLAESIAPNDPLRERINATLDRATQALRDARSRLLGLRSVLPDNRSLSAELSARAAQIPRSDRVRFDVRVAGNERKVSPGIDEEICRISTEGLTNAFQHAHASNVLLELRFDDAEFGMIIRDDGIGMAASLIEIGRSNHWGLTGMRERALSLGATIKITSDIGMGTELRVTLRAGLAYASPAISTSPALVHAT